LKERWEVVKVEIDVTDEGKDGKVARFLERMDQDAQKLKVQAISERQKEGKLNKKTREEAEREECTFKPKINTNNTPKVRQSIEFLNPRILPSNLTSNLLANEYDEDNMPRRVSKVLSSLIKNRGVRTEHSSVYQSLNFPSMKESTSSNKAQEKRKPSPSKSRDRFQAQSTRLTKEEKKTKEKKDVATDVMSKLEAIRDSKQAPQAGHLKLHVIYTEEGEEPPPGKEGKARSSGLTHLEKEEESPEKRICLMNDKLKLNVQTADKKGMDPIVQNVHIKNLLNVHNEESRIETDHTEQNEVSSPDKQTGSRVPIITHQGSGVQLQFVHIPSPPKTTVPNIAKDINSKKAEKSGVKASEKVVSKEQKKRRREEPSSSGLTPKPREQSIKKVEFGKKESIEENAELKPIKKETEKQTEAERPKPKLVSSTIYEPTLEVQKQKAVQPRKEKEQTKNQKEKTEFKPAQKDGKIVREQKNVDKEVIQETKRDKVVQKPNVKIIEKEKKKVEPKKEPKQENDAKMREKPNVSRERKLVIVPEPPKQKKPKDVQVVYRPAGVNSGSNSPKSPRILSKTLREGEFNDPEPKRSGSNSNRNSASPGSPRQEVHEEPKKKNFMTAWHEKKAAKKQKKPAELKYNLVSKLPELDINPDTNEKVLKSISEREEESNAHIRLSEQLVEEFENQFKGFAGIDINQKSGSSNHLGESNSKSIKMDMKHSQERFVSFQQSSASKDSRSASPVPHQRATRGYEPSLNRSPSPSYHEPSSLSILVSEDPKSKRSNSKESYQDRHSSSNRNSSRREVGKSTELLNKEIFYREVEKLGKSNAIKEIKDFEYI
jgi:hypothetical protein